MKSKRLLFIILFLFIIIVILLIKIINKDRDFKFSYKPYGSFLIPVQIGNKKFPFLLDTGATNSSIDTKLAKKLNLVLINNKLEVTDALNSSIKLDLIKPMKLKIGNYNILPSTLIVNDLSGIRKASGENIQGVIGLNIIRRFIWHIDIKNHKITLSTNPKIIDKQQCTKLQDDGYFLLIGTIYNKNKRNDNIEFILDTGSSSNQIMQEVANHLRKNKSVVENHLSKENPNILVTAKQSATINDSISYIHDINLLVINNDKEYLEPIILGNTDVFKAVSNLLGKPFIDQFEQVLINPYDMQFCFVKDKNKKLLQQIRQVRIIGNGNNQIIIDYNKSQYLNRLSLKNKDIIISINDKKYIADDITQVRHMLRYQSNLNLVIKRDNKLINVKLD